MGRSCRKLADYRIVRDPRTSNAPVRALFL